MQNYPWKENQVMVIDPQFFLDCESLLTNKKCHSVLAKLFEQIKSKGLLSGNNFELIKSSGKFNLYSIRINITDRLLLTTHNDYCCLVAIVANHDYDKNKYVRNPTSLDKLIQNLPKEDDFQLRSEQDMTHLFGIVNKYAPSSPSPLKQKFRPLISASTQSDDDEKYDVENERSDIEVAEILGQHLLSDETLSAYESFRGSLTPVQSRFMEIDSPKILQGCKGSGKTTALLGDMVNYVVSNPSSKLLYLHQSPTRLSQAKAQWELISHGDNQHVQFSTVDNLLQAKIKIDEKQFLLFQQWLKNKLGEYGFSRVVNSEDIFKELLTLEDMGRKSDAFDEDDLQTILKIEQDFKSYLLQHSYDLIVVDDAEKLESDQLKQIHELSHAGNACFAFNQHNMSMSVEKQIFLKTLRISPSAFNEVRLEGTFQYSNAVIEVMNHLLYLKRTMTDGKTETFSRASESPELIGEKDMLDAKQQDKLITYQALVANEQFVVVCHEQHIEKAKALFQTEEVYSYEQFQDRSAEGIILFNPLSEPGAVELNTKLKNIGTEKLDRSEYLDKLILSIQNAKKNIVLYQDFESDKEKHQVEKLFEYLSDGFGTKTEVEQVTQFSSALASQDKINSPLVVFSKPQFKPSPAGQKIIELIDNFNLENFIEFLEKNPKLDRVFFLPLNDEQNNLYHFLLANPHHLQEYFKLMLSSNQILVEAPLKDMLNKTPKAHPLRPMLEDMFRMQKSILKNKKLNMDLTNPLDTLVECNLIAEIDIFFARARELQIDVQYKDAAILAIEKNNKIALERLKDNGFDLSFLDAKGNNLLHYAVRFQRIDIIELLLSLGFDILQKNDMDETPLSIANKIAPHLARSIIVLNVKESQKKSAVSISMFSDNKENHSEQSKASPSGKK